MDELGKEASPKSFHNKNPFPIISDIKPVEILLKKKLESRKFQSDPELMQELRKKFQNALCKLSLTDTREVALKEAKCLIERNNSSEALRIYITSLSEHQKAKSHGARELEVYLLGYLSEVYNDKLIEESTPLRLLVKIAEAIQSYFKDLNKNVQVAAAKALCALYIYSLPKVSQQVVFSFMFEPLSSILTSGIDVQAQHSAALAIFTWAEVLVEEKNSISLLTLYHRTLTLFLKLRAEFLELISAIGLMIEKCGFQPVIDSLHMLLNKLLLYLKHPSSTAQALKLEACKLLAFIGKHLSDTGFVDVERQPMEILSVLKELRGEKTPLLQSTARETVKIWEKYQSFLMEISEKALQEDCSRGNIVAKYFDQSLQKQQVSFSHFRVIRNLIQVQKAKSSTSQIETIDTNNWGLQNKGFLKRGTGNYSVVTAQGLINIQRALEKRPSVKEFLQKTPYQINRRSVEILYKENSQVNVYERNKNQHIFEVQPPYNPCMFTNLRNSNDRLMLRKKCEGTDWAEGKLSPNFSEKSGKTPFEEPEISRISKNCSEIIEETENFEGFIHKPQENFEKNKGFLKDEVDFSEKMDLERPANQSRCSDKQSRSGNKSDLILKDSERFIPSQMIESGKLFLKKKSSKETLKIPKSPDFEIGKIYARPESNLSKKSSTTKNEENKSNFKFPPRLEIKKIQHIEIKPLKVNILKDIEEKRKIAHESNFMIQTPKVPNSVRHKSTFDDSICKKSEKIKRFSLSKEIQTSMKLSSFPNKHEKHLEDTNLFLNKPRHFPPPPIYSISLLEKCIHKAQKESEEKFSLMNLDLNLIEKRLEKVHKSLSFLKRASQKKPLFSLPNSFKSGQIPKKQNLARANTFSNADLLHKLQSPIFLGKKPIKHDPLTLSWKKTLEFVSKNDLGSAYENILKTGDDIYLLRLMHQTTPCLSIMSPETSKKILEKITRISESNFIQNIGLDWFTEAAETGFLQNLDSKSMHEIYAGLENVFLKDPESKEHVEKIYTLISQRIYN